MRFLSKCFLHLCLFSPAWVNTGVQGLLIASLIYSHCNWNYGLVISDYHYVLRIWNEIKSDRVKYEKKIVKFFRIVTFIIGLKTTMSGIFHLSYMKAMHYFTFTLLWKLYIILHLHYYENYEYFNFELYESYVLFYI